MSSEAPALLLRARGVGKAYANLGSPLARLAAALLGRVDRDRAEMVVLRDIDLDIHRGETVGIMGRNGAGKTTLLAILGRVLEPSTGTVERLAKVATLLEVGAGFNPQFTGRDNARLFCGVMGLTSAEAVAALPRIEAFAELGDYFDLPLKSYSSGMQARLGFACAAHVEADLVIIDETLAVGDASFRVKCYMRIKAMQEQGQTFLLVSHSPNLIANFCSRVIVLEQGRKRFDGAPLGAFDVYKDIREGIERTQATKAAARAAALTPGTAAASQALDPALALGPAELRQLGTGLAELAVELQAGEDIAEPVVSFGLRSQEGIVICGWSSEHDPAPLPPLRAGDTRPLRLTFRNLLLPGTYFVAARTGRRVGDVTVTINVQHNIARLEVVTSSTNRGLVDLGMRLEAAPLPLAGPDPHG